MNEITPSGSPEFVNARRLAELFDPPLSIGFIRTLQDRRAITFVRLGRRVLFPLAQVRQEIAAKYTVHRRKVA